MKSHLIDLVVIFIADLAAAYFALKWFEAHKEDRDRARQSLNDLYQACSLLSTRYTNMKKGFDNSDDATATGIARDITDADRKFLEFDEDILFWSFDGSNSFRNKYEEIKKMKDDLNPRTVGEAKRKLAELVTALASLKQDALEQLKPQSSSAWAIVRRTLKMK